MQKWNIPTNRAQKVKIRWKNGVILSVIMFTPRVMVIKMSKMAYFLYFFADESKKSVTVCAKCLSASTKSYLDLIYPWK